MADVNKLRCPGCGDGILRGGWCSKCFYRTPESRKRELEAQERRRAGDPANDHSTSRTWAAESGANRAGAPRTPDPGTGGRWPPPTPDPGYSSVPRPCPAHSRHDGTQMVDHPSGTSIRGAIVLDGTVDSVGDVVKETVDLRNALVASAAARGCLLLPLRLIEIIIVCLIGPLRFLLPTLLTSSSKRQQERYVVLERHPFVIQNSEGVRYDCYIRGELLGVPVRMGERVTARGLMERRTGLVRVSHLTNIETGATTTGYVDVRVRRQPYVIAASIIVLMFAFVILRRML